MSVQIYGQFDDYMSIPSVSRAICRELKRKRIGFTIWAHGSLQPQYIDAPWSVSMNSSAYVGVFIGYPSAAPAWLKGHKKKILVTVCETNKIPSTWVDACRQVDQIYVPSQFCRQVFIDSGVKTVPISILQHGITDFPKVRQEAALKKLTKVGQEIETGLDWDVNFLHVSGAVSFPQRKGTVPLLQAWKLVEEAFPTANLTLKIFPVPKLVELIDALKLTRVKIDDRRSLNPREMAQYLTYFDAVIQPSRGEGFGIIPLEARCNDVPVIMTGVSGHVEHYAPGVDVEIPTRNYSHMITQGNDEGFAPTVHYQDIFESIKLFLNKKDWYHDQTMLWSSRFREMWMWGNVLKPLSEQISRLTRKHDRIIRFGDTVGIRGA